MGEGVVADILVGSTLCSNSQFLELKGKAEGLVFIQKHFKVTFFCNFLAFVRCVKKSHRSHNFTDNKFSNLAVKKGQTLKDSN